MHIRRAGGHLRVQGQPRASWPSLLAAASVVVDYVLTVAVSLAAGAASLGSVFPGLASHLLLVAMVGLVILTVVNMFGIQEWAKVLVLRPWCSWSASSTIIVGAFPSPPVATIGRRMHSTATEALGDPVATEGVRVRLLGR